MARLTNFFKEFADLFSQENGSIPFYKLESVVKEFLKDSTTRGFSKPALVELTINYEFDSYKVKITSYFRDESTGKVLAEDKIGSFKEIINIPVNLRNSLEQEKTIKVKFNDPFELVIGTETPVEPAFYFDDMDKIVKRAEIALTEKGYDILGKRIKIEEKVFRKLIQFIFKVVREGKEDIKVHAVSYSDILNIPESVASVLSESGSIELEI
jgi:hypothetical protein